MPMEFLATENTTMLYSEQMLMEKNIIKMIRSDRNFCVLHEFL